MPRSVEKRYSATLTLERVLYASATILQDLTLTLEREFYASATWL